MMRMNNNVKINIPIETFNPVYVDNKILNNKNRYLLLYGGAGSGKSYFIAQRFLYRMLTEKKHRFLFCRKVARTLRNSMFSLMIDLINAWNLAKLFTINKSDMLISCINGNSILFVGLDDVEKLKSIAGITGIWIEEASEVSPQDFFQLDLRLRGKTDHYKQIVLSFNPISETNWIKKEFFDKEVDNCKILKTTYLDNKFIDNDYKKMIDELKHKDEVYYSIYALGNWGVLGNVIYSNYQVKEISQDKSDYEIVYNGMDFGFNDPSTLCKVGIKDNELYIFDELYLRGLTNAEFIEEAKKKVAFDEFIVAESAMPSYIKEFKQAGFKKIRGAKKGPDSIKSGIDKIRSHKVFIHPSCVNFIREINSYAYRKDKDGNFYDEPDSNCEDHLLDALRYAMELKTNKKQIKAGLSLY